jgi:diguanylate cyclase
MRYAESREQSAELLRVALAHMGRHDAAFNPLTFAVWYEYAAGNNTKLARAIEECLATEAKLGDETIARLYRDHVSEVDELAVQRASGEFQRVMLGMAESASRTGAKAGAFGEQLNGLTLALRAAEAPALEPVLNQALAGTAEMKDTADALQQQVIASRHEIERLRHDLSRARDEALVDPLTRILNRKGFDQKLQAMMDQAGEHATSHCLVLLDIDRFKVVNDTYGHMMGDRVLQAVAEVLSSCVSDPTHSVARYGGEEFAILLPQRSVDFALALAETSRQRIGAMNIHDRRTRQVVLTVTISAGVAEVQPGDDAASLIGRADGALYAAKQAGRDRVSRA